MALLTFLPADPSSHDLKKHAPNSKRKKKQQQQIKTQKQQQPSSSWDQIKNLLTCKQIEDSKIHDPSRNNNNIYTSCSSICTFRDVVHGNTRVVHRADNSPESSTLGQETRLLSKKSNHGSSSRSINSSSVRSGAGGAPYTGRGMQLRKLSGCYECHASVDPSRYPLPRTTICACSECGEVFPKIESLEHHQAVRHAVSELGPENSSRNIVEIIFKSSWLKKDNPICKIERILLKVNNTQRTIQRFEDYRDAVKTRATSNARCAADGNELLRFHCATLTCSLVQLVRLHTGLRCLHHHPPWLSRQQNQRNPHHCQQWTRPRFARRIGHAPRDARVPRDCGAREAHGGAASTAGGSYLEELHVFSSRAILPCFVVIYKALDA